MQTFGSSRQPLHPKNAHRGASMLPSGKRKEAVYKSVVSMYKKDPSEMSDESFNQTMSLEKVEQLMLARYKILLTLDSLAATHTKYTKEYDEELIKRIQNTQKAQNAPGRPKKGKVLDEDAAKTISMSKIVTEVFTKTAIENSVAVKTAILEEQWSHFLLRLAYSRSEELRKWFLELEVDLFRFRVKTQLAGSARQNFLKNENLNFDKVKKTDVEGLSAYILDDHPEVYQVSWVRVLALVKQRKVFLRDGWAYVSEDDIIDILADEFKTHLQKQLALGQRHWATGGLEEEEQRLVPIFNFFTTKNSASYASNNADGTITVANLDEVAEQNFPLCQLYIHKHWRQHHHMKHMARLVYWRFLKQAGMSVEDCMEAFRLEGNKTSDGAKKYEKEFRYNIRHAYGKEGKRADYTGFGCMYIIQNNPPGCGECHGCPYKHRSAEEVTRVLRESGGISDTAVLRQILKLADQEKYQIACAKHLEGRHANRKDKLIDIEDIASGIVSPNQYFDKSIAISQGKIGKTESQFKKEQEEKAAKQNSGESKGNRIKVEWNYKSGDVLKQVPDSEFQDIEIPDEEPEENEPASAPETSTSKPKESPEKPTQSDEEDDEMQL